MKIGPAGLYIDLETSLILCGVYSLFRQESIPYSRVIRDWFLICGSWKWLDGKRIYSTSLLDDLARFKRDPFDDFLPTKKLYEVVSEADFIVGHNVKRFDWPKLIAKFKQHGLPPIPEPVLVDTLTTARRFGFTSRSLDALNRRLDLTAKLQHEPGLAMRVLSGERKAVEEYTAYNRGDIASGEELYYELRPYILNHPNFNLWRGDGVECCPTCGHEEFVPIARPRVTPQRLYQRMRCASELCGKCFTLSKPLRSTKIKPN